MIQRMLEAIASILDLSGRKAIEDLRRIQIELEEGQEALDWYVIRGVILRERGQSTPPKRANLLTVRHTK